MSAKPSGSISRRSLTGLIYLVMSLSVWEVVVRSYGIRPSVLPSPSRVALELWRQSSSLLNHAWVTSSESLSGMIIAAAVGFAWAAASSWPGGAGQAVAPILSGLQRLPWLALAPLLAIWLGFGRAPATALAFLICLFPLTSGIRDGFLSLPPEIIDILKTMGAGSVQIFLHAQLPASLPFLTAALRRTLPLAFGGAVVAEFVSSNRGLGFFMMYEGARGDTTQLIAALVFLGLLVLGLQAPLAILEHFWIDRIAWSRSSPEVSAGHYRSRKGA